MQTDLGGLAAQIRYAYADRLGEMFCDASGGDDCGGSDGAKIRLQTDSSGEVVLFVNKTSQIFFFMNSRVTPYILRRATLMATKSRGFLQLGWRTHAGFD